MCNAGDDKDDGNDSAADKVAAGGGRNLDADMAAGSRYSDEYESGTPDVSNYSTNEGYTNAVLTSKGYSDDYKGVKSGSGSAVLDGFGNPVMSGTYDRTRNEAESTFDAYQDYTVAREKAQAEFYSDMEARQQIDQSQIDMAMNSGGYIGDFYNADGTVRADYDPTQAVNSMMGPPSAQNLKDYGNYLGSSADEFSFPGFSFSDPYGTAMAPRLSQIDGSALGSEITTQSERDYFDNFAAGYKQDNKSGFFGLGGNRLETDAAGNIGTSTGGQRFSDAAGNIIMGLVGSAFGPIGSAIAAGTNVNTMNAYGEVVPGYMPTVETISFGPGQAFGGLLGSALGGKASQAVGQKIYDSTGNVNNAIGGAVATGVGLNVGGAALGSQVDSAYGLGYVGSNTSSPYQSQIDQEMESRGFGDSISGGTGGGESDGQSAEIGQLQSQLSPNYAPMSTMGTGVNDTEIQNVASADVGAGNLQGNTDTEFDATQFFLTQARNANPNSTQPVDLFGEQTADLSANPLFNAAPAGVQYLSRGRQRQFGTGTNTVMNAMQRKNSNRRGGIGDRLVGVIV